MKKYDYENMLGLVQLDIKNYQQRLSQFQVNKDSQDDIVIRKQLEKVLEETKSLELYIKCAIGEF